MRIAILSPHGEVIGFLDDSLPKSLKFCDLKIHEITSGAGTLEFETTCQHSMATKLVTGNHLSFLYAGRGYYYTIMTVEKSRTTNDSRLYVYAQSFSLSLIAQEQEPFSSEAKTFEKHMESLPFYEEHCIEVNEVADQKVSWALEGYNTVLACLYSLATQFNAELEIRPLLNGYRFRMLVINVYKKRAYGGHGLGADRTQKPLRVGKEIDHFSMSDDFTEFCSAVRPTGLEGLSLEGYKPQTESVDGFESFMYGKGLCDPQARAKYPVGYLYAKMNGYLCKDIEVDTENQAILYREAADYLRLHNHPKIVYDITGQVAGDIGDTYVIVDELSGGQSQVTARISERELYPQDESKNVIRFTVE